MPVRTELVMGTLVTMRALATDSDAPAAMDRGFAWFREIEGVCTRFDAASELRRATERSGVAVPVSPILFEAVRFALLVGTVARPDSKRPPVFGAGSAGRASMNAASACPTRPTPSLLPFSFVGNIAHVCLGAVRGRGQASDT